ncbi:polysaccharide deacetylase family protein [Paraferrimonas sp. SM1919]|uniref:polysaccharide deacetylase family protein n=1 Tax=Paraferrimonas sp. SM1919 TaxID=2662263 RepID=UPI0013D58C58|nr:polysaccharide deacetylase family protein [Paraferrimonas sp. SM1919]
MKADLGHFDYWPYQNRPKIRWPQNKKMAFWVAPNIEFYELHPPNNPYRKPWPTPSPDISGYGIRDYGNRVGHVRQMQLLDKYGIRGSVSLSTALCQHHPEIVEMAKDRNWEFFSHGIYNTRYSYGMSEQQERDMIKDSIATIFQATGQKCAGYLAPALSHSELTLDLFAEVATELFGDDAGFYTCDLFHDDQPTPINLRSGKKFVSIPYSLEMNDTIAYVVNKVEPRRYGQMLMDNFDTLYQEADSSGTIMCIPTHNYQVSCPHRIKAFEQALEYITDHDDVWLATGSEIAKHFIDNYYQDAITDINNKGAK